MYDVLFWLLMLCVASPDCPASADLNIQIRDKLFIHWNLSGGGAGPGWFTEDHLCPVYKTFCFKIPPDVEPDNWGREMADSDIGKRYWQQLNVVN